VKVTESNYYLESGHIKKKANDSSLLVMPCGLTFTRLRQSGAVPYSNAPTLTALCGSSLVPRL